MHCAEYKGRTMGKRRVCCHYVSSSNHELPNALRKTNYKYNLFPHHGPCVNNKKIVWLTSLSLRVQKCKLKAIYSLVIQNDRLVIKAVENNAFFVYLL